MTVAWILAMVEEVDEFKRYSGRPEMHSIQGLRENSVQKLLDDSHDCIERDTIQDGFVPETSLRQCSHPKKGPKHISVLPEPMLTQFDSLFYL